MKHAFIALVLLCAITSASTQITKPTISFDPISVTTIAGTGEAGFADGPASTAQFNSPNALAAIGNDIYVADGKNHRIRKISVNGTVSTFAGSGIEGSVDGPAAIAQFTNPSAIAADREGNLYVVEYDANSFATALRKIRADGVVSTLIAADTHIISLSSGIAVDTAGNVYLSSEGIIKLTPAGLQTEFVHNPGVQPYWDLRYMAFDPPGNLYVQQSSFARPLKISPAGVVTSIPTPAAYWGNLAIDKKGNIYVTDNDYATNNTISFCRFSPQGVRTVLAGKTPGYKDDTGTAAQFGYSVGGIAADDAGNVYSPDPFYQRIRKISVPDLHFTTSAGLVSATAYFSISGISITEAATLQAPAAYELSLNEAGPFSNSLSVSPVAGEINAIKVYIRLRANLAAGTYNDAIVLSADGATTQQLAVTGIVTPPGQGSGLQGVYYNGRALSGTPLLTRIDPVINFDLSWASPAPGTVPQDNYSVRWSGQVQAQYSETYTFYTTSDDGIRLWVNGVQLVDNWVNQDATEKSGTIALVAGQKYDIVVEYYEAAGDAVTRLSWSSPGTPKAIVPPSQLYPAPYVATSAHGLKGVYYNGPDVAGTPLLTRIDSTINFNLGWMSPAPGTVPQDNYSVRWTGQVQAQYSEIYTFYTSSDDGIRLWVNGVQLVDNWVNQDATEKSGTIALVAGQKYNIVIEYYEAAGDAVTQLSWSSPSTPKQIVPPSQLFPPNYLPPPGIGLQGAYYNGTNLSGTPLLTRIDPVINFDLAYKSPAPGIVPQDNYSVIWTGQVQAQYNETYTFYTSSDDGIRLWINGVQLVNDWMNQDATEYSGTIALTAGQKYDIVIEYYEAAGDAVTQLSWSSLSTPKQIVPQSQLFPTLAAAAAPCVTNISPANGSILATATTANLSWTAYSTAVRYDIYLRRDDPTPLVTHVSIPASSGTNYLADGLAPNTAYFWYVLPATENPADNTCNTASATSFTTAASAARVMNAPANAAPASLLKTAENSSLASITAVISPNPVHTGQPARLQINSNKNGMVVINTVGGDGKLIDGKKVNLVQGANTVTLSTTGLAQGFHIITIAGADKPLNLKLVVQ